VIILLVLILIAIIAPSAFVWVPVIAGTFFGKFILAGIAMGTVAGILEGINRHNAQDLPLARQRAEALSDAAYMRKRLREFKAQQRGSN
jgi:hypothetical protein